MTDRMCELLDAVHVALRQADFGVLGGLTEAIALCVPDLEKSGDHMGMLRVQRMAKRNAICLMATQRGLRAARRRVDEIRLVRSGLVTYDTTGRRTQPISGGSLRERF